MSCLKRGSEQKFWTTPELIEALLPFLDAPSTKCLAEIHPLFLNIVQGVTVWKKLLKRSFPDSTSNSWLSEKTLKPLKFKVESLALILKMADGTKDPPLELDLLHILCTMFPVRGGHIDPKFVNLSCSCHKNHRVSPLGFMLLETAEGILGTAEQTLMKVHATGPGLVESGLIMGLSSRADRQESEFIVECFGVRCSSKKQAHALSSLVKNSKWWVHLRFIEVNKGIEKEGWGEMRRAIHGLYTRNPGLDFHIDSTREAMVEGERTELRAIWEDMVRHGARSYWEVKHEDYNDGFKLYRSMAEKHWGEMEQILDMCEEDWKVKVKALNRELYGERNDDVVWSTDEGEEDED